MAGKLKLQPHPRLYVGEEEFGRLQKPPRLPLLREAAAKVQRMAEEYLVGPPTPWDRTTHNPHLTRGRRLGNRVTTLLVRWRQTGDERYRAAALAYIVEMGAWKHWSWIAWRRKDPRPEAVFDLSHGENSSTLAFAYDWLAGTLSEAEHKLILDIAERRVFDPFLLITAKENLGKMELADPWWFGWPTSNWNAVCCGGAGLLALALYDELPQARRVLTRVERSLKPFFGHLKTSDGAWPEGTAYWNFGMRFAFAYLLSCERATGRRHPLLAGPEIRKTLRFPMDFCPNQVHCSFGDVNHWAPLAVHFAMAERLGRRDVLAMLQDYEPEKKPIRRCWPTEVELLLLHPRKTYRQPPAERNVVKLYRRQDWGVLADRMPRPRMYLAVRGGNMKAPHAHRDLLSYHCVIGDEAMITNTSTAQYLDIPYGQRRYEQSVLNEKSKNTILVNSFGLGGEGAFVKSSTIALSSAKGIRMDATESMCSARGLRPLKFCGRAFLMLPGQCFVIVDRVEMTNFGLVESRLHTDADVQAQRAGAKLTGERQKLRIAYAADAACEVNTGQFTPPTPGPGAKMIRWITSTRAQKTVTMVTLLSPGHGLAKVALAEKGANLVITVTRSGRTRRLTLTKRLRPPRKRRQ